MIKLTGITGKIFYLNPDLIYRMEEVPDTTITLVDGKSLVVKEEAFTVVQRIIHYRKQIYHQPLEELINKDCVE